MPSLSHTFSLKGAHSAYPQSPQALSNWGQNGEVFNWIFAAQRGNQINSSRQKYAIVCVRMEERAYGLLAEFVYC